MLLAALVLYAWRHVVQDKQPMRLREEVPRTPEEERAHPELRLLRPGARRDECCQPLRSSSLTAYSARSSQRGRSEMTRR